MNLLASTGTPDEYGGAIIAAAGLVFYGLVVLKDWLVDVRYYRARRIVRSRGRVG